MSYDLVVKNGTIISPGGCFPADVAVVGEQIAALGTNLHGSREIDASGRYVLPGAIDGHVHLADTRSASPLTADTFASGTAAAAFGGVTTIIDFAESQPGTPLAHSLELRSEDARGQAYIDYSFHMNIRDEDVSRLEEIPQIVSSGVPSFKVFMAFEAYRLTDVTMFRIMDAVARQDGLVIVHAEDDQIITELRRREAGSGMSGARLHAASSPPVTESSAIHRALALAELTGARVLIFHVSTREGLRELTHARSRGQIVYAEACPQYLLLSDAVYGENELVASSLMVRPPLRDPAQQEALWQGLAEGRIDVVSSDHTPRKRQKNPPVHPPGASGIETRLMLLHTFGVAAGRMNLERWVEVCCANPARIFGLSRKGQLLPGHDADVVVFDPEMEAVLSSSALHSELDYSTYEGMKVYGMPMTTICRGQVVVENHELVGSSNFGKFIHRVFGS
jgi:dihydropyrimidinase